MDSSQDHAPATGAALEAGDYEIVYARVLQERGECTAVWMEARRLDTGEVLHNCVEADATAGWFVQFKLGPDGKSIAIGTEGRGLLERIEAPVEIKLRDDAPAYIWDAIRLDIDRGFVRVSPRA